MKNIAKILCFVLSLVLIISVMGVSAFADETDYVAYTVDSNFENRVDYTTLAEAIEKVPNGGYIYLVADVTESIPSFTGINLLTDVEAGVTINNTYTQYPVDFDNSSIGYGITLNVNALYTGGSENSIDGTVNVAGDYLHGYDAKTNVFGTLTVGGELLLTENTDMSMGINNYGTIECDTITIDNGYFGIDWLSVLTCENFTVNSLYETDIYVDSSATISITNVSISADADYKAVANGDGTYSLVMKNYVAEVDGVKYEDFTAAIAALQEGSTLTLLSDITIDGEWHRSGTGKSGKYITKSVTIDGNYCTLTFTGKIVDPNYSAIFAFLGQNVTINNLTIDAAAATGYKEIISTKYSVELNGCNFYGNGNRSALVYGQGAGTSIGTVTATINGCTFSGVKTGVSDNMNKQDAKSVTITDSTFDGCRVNVSAAESIVFTGNSVYGNQVILTTYSATKVLDVVATGNELDSEYSNWTSAVTGTIQSDFYATVEGDIYIGDNGNWFIGGMDTGYIAVSSITIEDGCWVINGYPTYIPAEAVSGASSYLSIVDGYWYVNDVNTKVRAEAFDGLGIAKVEKSADLSDALISTYVVTFTDGTTFTFTVTNGIDGGQGPVGPEGPMGPEGPKGQPGANGIDGEDNKETLQIAIIVASASVVLALVVLACRVFKKDRFALPF